VSGAGTSDIVAQHRVHVSSFLPSLKQCDRTNVPTVSMRRLQIEPDKNSFNAAGLINPPFVYVWIPVALLSLTVFVCLVRIWLKPRSPGAPRRSSLYLGLFCKHALGDTILYLTCTV
jgi:hypothetical protein